MAAASAASAQEGGTSGLTLPTIDVSGEQGGYQATEQSITRLPTALLDTPQTVNVVPQQIIQEQRASTMEDALRTVPGITFSAGEGGQQGDSPYIRGFVARGDIFRDGVRDPGWYTRDLFAADRVEVYKGPSAFAFGRGATGGAINTVSKLPNGQTFIEATGTGSTPLGGRLDLDAGGKKGAVSGRVAAVIQDVDTPTRDNVWTKRWGFAPSVSIDLTDSTRATFSYIYQNEESVPDYGHPYLPAPAANVVTGARTGGYYGNGSPTGPVPIDRSNWFGVKEGALRDLVTTQTNIVTGKLEHIINDALKVTNVTRYIYNDRMARPTAPRSLLQGDNVSAVTPGYPVDQMTIGRQHFQTQTNNALLINQTDLNARFDTGTIHHTLVTGVELAQEKRWQQRASGMTATNLCDQTNILCRTSLSSPSETSFGGVFAGMNDPNSTLSNTYAVYASDQVKLNRYFELLGALRYDKFRTSYDPGNAPVLEESQGMLSHRYGIVFHPVRNVSVYAVTGVSFNPSSELGTLSNGNVSLDPEKTRSYEVGVKADVLDQRLSLTAAVFRIEKTNMRVANDPSLPTAQQFQVLDGLARVDGFEIGAVGKLTDQWQVFTGYSYLDSEIVQSNNAAEVGSWLPNTPRHNFTLWTTYDLTPRWTVGGGATHQSMAYVNTVNTSFVPAYWKFDAMVAYKVDDRSTIQLNVYNITDQLYYAQYYGGHAVPASGRWASLSWRVRF
jgi:catecholate siderophore receptor